MMPMTITSSLSTSLTYSFNYFYRYVISNGLRNNPLPLATLKSQIKYFVFKQHLWLRKKKRLKNKNRVSIVSISV